MKELEKIEKWDLHDVTTKVGILREEKWYPEPTKENIKILVDKVNALTEAVNKLAKTK